MARAPPLSLKFYILHVTPHYLHGPPITGNFFTSSKGKWTEFSCNFPTPSPMNQQLENALHDCLNSQSFGATAVFRASNIQLVFTHATGKGGYLVIGDM